MVAAARAPAIRRNSSTGCCSSAAFANYRDEGKLQAVTLSEIAEVLAGQSAGEIRHVAQKGISPARARRLFPEPAIEDAGSAVDWGASGEETLDMRAPAADLADAMDEESFSSAIEPPEDPFSKVTPPSAAQQKMARPSARRQALQARVEKGAKKIGMPKLAQMFEPAMEQSQATSMDAQTDDLRHLALLLREIQDRARVGAKISSTSSGERLIRVPISRDILLSVRHIPEKDAHLVEQLASLLKRLGRLK